MESSKICKIMVICVLFYLTTCTFCFKLDEKTDRLKYFYDILQPKQCTGQKNAVRESYEQCMPKDLTLGSCDKIESSTTKSQEACNQYKMFFVSRLKFRQTSVGRNYLMFIAGGRLAELSEFPHMAALGFYNIQEKLYQFSCGGTLISSKYVVSAAHCIKNPEGSELKIVRIGSIFIPPSTEGKDPSTDVDVKKIIVHEKYNRRKRINDIALVQLAEKITFGKSRRPACLYTEREHPPKMEVTGWGDLGYNRERSHFLQKATVYSIPMQECSDLYANRYSLRINSGHICAGNATVNTCQGDSGGPLQTRIGKIFYLIGVTSYGEACGSRFPGIYTRISSYLDWIESKVWP